MQIERSFTVAAPIERVWQFINSPEEVGPCMPGCQKVEVIGPGKYTAVISIKVGPIKTTFNFSIDTVQERAPEFAVFLIRGDEGGSASKVTAENTLTLKAQGKTATEVTYSSKVSIVGRLGKFAGGVMQKLAESQSDLFVAAMRARIEPEQPAAAAEPAAASGGMLATLRQWLAALFGLFRRSP